MRWKNIVGGVKQISGRTAILVVLRYQKYRDRPTLLERSSFGQFAMYLAVSAAYDATNRQDGDRRQTLTDENHAATRRRAQTARAGWSI